MHHHDHDYDAFNDNSGGLWCLFGLLMFIGAAVCFIVALIALTIHSFCKAIIAYQEGRYVDAVMWGGLLVMLAIAWTAGYSQ